MYKVIVYPSPENSEEICVVYPTGDIPVEDVAKKDVPKDTPYLIIDSSELPSSKIFRKAWRCDFSNPHGYAIGHEEWKKLIGKQ